MISAALQHDVGWPEPAVVVAWIELMHSQLAVFQGLQLLLVRFMVGLQARQGGSWRTWRRRGGTALWAEKQAVAERNTCIYMDTGS